ncbi:hypothetical protein ONZ45_g19671 [Pleurotus djamor]|nr:hypothetical protein ONZ45_g19671 [Pleurotus djamor]
MTLDVIGLAGFNYSFNTLKSDEPNELNQAFSTIFQAGRQNRLLMVLRFFFPILYSISVMRRIGTELLTSSKAAVAQSRNGDHKDSVHDLKSRNLLSLLVRANTSDDIPESSKLNDEDVLAQIPTFIVAGHETTSTATTWALFSLSQYPEIQSTLREELLSLPTEKPSMDELNSLPYLDRVVREALRVHSPVPMVARSAAADDIIPLSQPVTDVHGAVHHTIQVKTGQIIMLPIASTNTFEPIWGEDALEFKPDRWLNPPQASSAIPGVWSNQLTFLGGSRACIGYRFSLVEMKALLFTLVRAFEFELAVPASEISKKSMIVQRPVLKNNPQAGNVLPMIIKPVRPL